MNVYSKIRHFQSCKQEPDSLEGTSTHCPAAESGNKSPLSKREKSPYTTENNFGVRSYGIEHGQ